LRDTTARLIAQLTRIYRHIILTFSGELEEPKKTNMTKV